MSYFLAPALAQLRAEVNALWPHRDKTSDGWIGDASHAARPSDHNPDWKAPPPARGIVRALDLDEDLTVGLAEVGAAMPLVNAILTDARVRYVIYEGRIWYVDRPWWHPYTGPNAHRHHVHVSVRAVGSYALDGSSWNLAARLGYTPSNPAPALPDVPPPPPPPEENDDMGFYVYADTNKGVYFFNQTKGKLRLIPKDEWSAIRAMQTGADPVLPVEMRRVSAKFLEQLLALGTY